MKATAIRCPACGTQKEIYLRTQSSVIIFNCPDCGALLLFHEGKAFHISKKGIRDAIRACGSRNIEGILAVLAVPAGHASRSYGSHQPRRHYRPGH
jgi:ribosomal protein S27E